MKRFFTALLAIASILITGQAFAQEASAAEKKQAEIRKLAQEMNLTPDQAKSVQAIRKKYAPQRQAIEDKTLAKIQKLSDEKGLSEKAYKAKLYQLLDQRKKLLQPIKSKENQEMKKILSPSQQKTWEKFQKLLAGG